MFHMQIIFVFPKKLSIYPSGTNSHELEWMGFTWSVKCAEQCNLPVEIKQTQIGHAAHMLVAGK